MTLADAIALAGAITLPAGCFPMGSEGGCQRPISAFEANRRGFRVACPLTEHTP